MRLYGEQFEVAGDPIVITDNLVLVDAIEVKSPDLQTSAHPASNSQDRSRTSCINLGGRGLSVGFQTERKPPQRLPDPVRKICLERLAAIFHSRF